MRTELRRKKQKILDDLFAFGNPGSTRMETGSNEELLTLLQQVTDREFNSVMNKLRRHHRKSTEYGSPGFSTTNFDGMIGFQELMGAHGIQGSDRAKVISNLLGLINQSQQ